MKAPPEPMTDPSISPVATAPEAASTERSAAFAVLPGFGVIEVAGLDAASFLQGQLSSDVGALAEGRAQYSSVNSPKGRMLANFVLGRTGPDRFAIVLAADLASTIAKRLGLYVLRAKASVRDVSPERAVIGIAGATAVRVLSDLLGHLAPAPFGCVEAHALLAIALPDGRFLLLAPQASLPDLEQRLVSAAERVDASRFDRLAIEAGVPLVTAATTDQFVPQTANWEVLGGVAFDKGCYTGQEIIARTQYLGRLKERLQRFHSPVPTAAGARLYSPAFGEQACGTVVNVAPADDGFDLLAVVQTDAIGGDRLALDAPGGQLLTRQPLPYALPVASGAPRERLR